MVVAKKPVPVPLLGMQGVDFQANTCAGSRSFKSLGGSWSLALQEPLTLMVPGL